MPNYSTHYRTFRLKLSEYEEDDLLIEEMSGREAVSQLFEFRLRLLSHDKHIDPRKIIAKKAVLSIETQPDSSAMLRHWHGVVSRFQRTGRAASAEDQDIYTYECDIVPWLWFLTHHEDNRIFQNMTVPKIVETIFGDFEYSDFKMELSESHPTLEYCTQYNETSFAFISRLCEREGIYYYFRHNEDDETKHILVFTDNNANNPALEPDTYPYHHAGRGEGDADAILTLLMDQQMRTRKVTLRDWDFTKKKLLQENTPTLLSIGEDRDLERYRYPGGFVEAKRGVYLSRMIMEAEEASHMRFHGRGQIRTLTPGHRFTLTGHTFVEFNIEYMVLSVRHHGRNNMQDSPAFYENNFTLQPKHATWRAPLSTPKGRVRGPQTALVVGPPGEEIHTDEHGRIKVQFHWDRHGQYNDKSSCYVRVAQAWAGNGYGTVFIPRMGMEVVVDFLEGDPDQPIVTGCVYNGVNKPPYPLPANATRSGIKTLSSKGGGGTNELRFEDKKGDEEVFLQAQKALNVLVKANKVEEIGGDADLKITGKRTIEVTGKCSQHFKADCWTGVGGDYLLNPKGAMQLASNDDARFLSKQSVAISAKAGQVEIKAMTNIVLEAKTTVSLKCGPSSVVLSPSGVTIVGPMVRINSGAAPLSATMYSLDLTPDATDGVDKTSDGKLIDPLQQLQAQALRNAALSGQPLCTQCAAARAAYQRLMA